MCLCFVLFNLCSNVAVNTEKVTLIIKHSRQQHLIKIKIKCQEDVQQE